jgi:hypothetical protein
MGWLCRAEYVWAAHSRTAGSVGITEEELVRWHGAPCRVPTDATAFPHRKPGIFIFATAVWQDPAQQRANVGWVERVWSVVAPHTRGAYVNLLEDEGPQRVRAAYGDNHGRLVRIKQKYDPANLFRLNPNVTPIG